MDEFKDLTKEEIIKRFASLEFNLILDYYKNAPDLNAHFEEGRTMERNGDRSLFRNGGKSEYTRLFINLGSVDDFNRGDLLGFICNNTHISGRNIGKIDVKGVYSFFEVMHDDVDKVTNGFKGIDFKGRPVRIEHAGEGESRSGGSGGYPKRDGGYRGGERNGSGDRRPHNGGYNGNRNGGERNGSPERSYSGGGGFRDFSGKTREDRGERRRRF